MSNFGFSESQKESILQILQKQQSITKAVIFGSRARNDFKATSDVDLVIWQDKGENVIAKLKSEFEDSTLPYLFDILDYETIDNKKLKNEVDREGKIFYLKRWKETTLGKVVELIIDNRGRNPEYYTDSGIPVIDNILIKDSRKINLLEAKRFIDENLYNNFIRKHGEAGDVIITLVGNGYGNIALFPQKKSVIIQNTIGIRSNKKSLNLFLYYALRFSKKKILDLNIGAAQPSIKVGDLKNIIIPIPSLPEQKAIAEVLSSLDDKIELLRKQNKTLENTAQVIFKEWFGKYKAEDELPEGWRVYELGEISKLIAGGDRPKNTTIDKTDTNIIPIYSNGISNDGLYGYTDVPRINEESVTISARGTIGYISLRSEPYVPIVRLISITPINKYLSSKYLFLWLKNQNISGTGTTQQQLTIPDFSTSKIIIPESIIMDKFTIILDSLYKKISDNKNQIQTLSTLRDTLLPKLMKGEVRVKI